MPCQEFTAATAMARCRISSSSRLSRRSSLGLHRHIRHRPTERPTEEEEGCYGNGLRNKKEEEEERDEISPSAAWLAGPKEERPNKKRGNCVRTSHPFRSSAGRLRSGIKWNGRASGVEEVGIGGYWAKSDSLSVWNTTVLLSTCSVQ